MSGNKGARITGLQVRNRNNDYFGKEWFSAPEFPSNCPSHFDQIILYFSFVLSINETAVNCGTGL